MVDHLQAGELVFIGAGRYHAMVIQVYPERREAMVQYMKGEERRTVSFQEIEKGGCGC